MINTEGVDFVVVTTLAWLIVAVLWLLNEVFYFVRPIIPVPVNCWFCNESTWVFHKDSNSWDCSSCLQYNGFTEDGDYNKDIPEQYEYVNMSFAVPKLMTQVPQVLCKQCNAVQEQKIKKLAKFVPENPASYDTELEHYRLKLELEYSLCRTCEKLVSRIINQKLAKALRVEYKNSQQKHEKAPQNSPQKPVQNVSSMWPVFCHMLCFTLAVCLGLATWFKKQHENSEFPIYFMNILEYKQYITIIPLIVLLLIVITDSCSVPNVGSVIVWMAVHFLPWLIIETDTTDYLDSWKRDNFELVLLVVAAFINIIAAKRRHKTILKKVHLTKIPVGHPKSSSSGKQYTKPAESNICEEEMNTMPQNSRFALIGPRLNLGKRQYFSSHKDQLDESSNTYNYTPTIRPSHFPVFGAPESIPRPRTYSLLRGYRQLHKSFRDVSSQKSMFSQDTNQNFR